MPHAPNRLKHLWPNLSQSLGFIPGLLVVAFGASALVLAEVDKSIELDGVSVVFQGDASAARTVLSVVAGSLITVAGLTFSITMVVLQLASSQFSPRILRTFFGDRLTQVTIGTFVGTFAYSLLVLREVGSLGDAGFVPRLSTTVATLLGIAAVLLLVAFLQHAEVWPESAGDACAHQVRAMVSVSSERDLDQDVDFGIRQLTDTALRAVSPGINDPMTAVTCIWYVRSILVRMAGRASPPRVREFPDQDLTALVRRRSFDEHLERLLQINRYAAGDAWVSGEVLAALQACARTARECGAAARLPAIHDTARVVAEQARREARNDRDRDRIDRLAAEVT